MSENDPIAAVDFSMHGIGMESYSRGFTAPSASFPGATISLECVRYFEGDQYIDGEWRTNVFANDGGWVGHSGSDNVQDTLEAMVTMLAPFYDGTAFWLDGETGESLTFWEMVVRTTPTKLGPPIKT